MDGRDDFQLFADNALFVVRWRNPTKQGALALTPLLQRHHDAVGEPLMFAILIGPDCPPPSPEVREVMLREHDAIHELTRAVHTVIIGGTVRQTIMRSVMTAMTLAASLRGKPFKVDKNLTELAKIACERLGGESQALLDRMIAAGIVTAAEAGTSAGGTRA